MEEFDYFAEEFASETPRANPLKQTAVSSLEKEYSDRVNIINNVYEKIGAFLAVAKTYRKPSLSLNKKLMDLCKSLSHHVYNLNEREDRVDEDKMLLKPRDVTIIPYGGGLQISWKGKLPMLSKGCRAGYPFYSYGIQAGLTEAIHNYLSLHPTPPFSPANRALVKLNCAYRIPSHMRDYDNIDTHEIFNALKAELFVDDSPKNFALLFDSTVDKENRVEITIVPQPLKQTTL